MNHPQTVGKLERFHQTYEKHRGRFATLEEFVQWHNDVRVHMRHVETPSQAFVRRWSLLYDSGSGRVGLIGEFI